MISEVDAILWQWGEWVDRRESNGLGYKMSGLNAAMAQACAECTSPKEKRRQFDDEQMTLIDAVLCQIVKPESKRIIDRYYRGVYVGEGALAQSAQRRRAGAYTAAVADALCIHRDTVRVWIHNAQVEFQKAMASIVTRLKAVGVVGVIADLMSCPVAVNSA